MGSIDNDRRCADLRFSARGHRNLPWDGQTSERGPRPAVHAEFAHEALEVLRDREKRCDREKEPDESVDGAVAAALPKARKVRFVQGPHSSRIERIDQLVHDTTERTSPRALLRLGSPTIYRLELPATHPEPF